MNTTNKKKLRSYVINISSKSKLRIDIFISSIRQNYKHSRKKKKIGKKNLKKTVIIILTKKQ